MLTPFTRGDFDLFAPEKQKDPEWDGPRLGLKRKLKAWADAAKGRIEAAHGLVLKAQTSLHRPYKHNQYRVECQRAVLTATAAGKAGLKEVLGEEFREDVGSGVVQMTLALTVAFRHVEAALRVHPGAWWDGLGWQKAAAEAGEELGAALRALPEEFRLATAPKGGEWPCLGLEARTLRAALARYRPAEQWISVSRIHPREGLEEGPEDQEELLLGDLVDLGPVYALVKRHAPLG